MSGFFDPARNGLPSAPRSHLKKKTQPSPMARSTLGSPPSLASSQEAKKVAEDSSRQHAWSNPAPTAAVGSPERFVHHQKGSTLPPLSIAALSVNMKCWKSRRRQRRFAGPDIWHSCPQQRRHVPAELGLGAAAFTGFGSRRQTSGPEQRGHLHLHPKLTNN